jgi:integrase
MAYAEKKIETLIKNDAGQIVLDLLLRSYTNGKKVYFARCRIDKMHLANNQRRVVRSLLTDDLETARSEAHQQYALIKVRQESNQSIKVVSVNQVINKFFENYESALESTLAGYSEHMLRGYRKNIDIYWREYLGDRNINTITTQDLDGYERFRQRWARTTTRKRPNDQRYKDTISKRTITWEVNAFRQVLRWAGTQNLYTGRAYEWTYAGGRESRTRRSSFTIEQYRTLYRYMRSNAFLNVGKHKHRNKSDSRIVRHRHMIRAYILFMANTGLRVGEARHLRFSDISQVTNKKGQTVCVIRVDEDKSKVKKSNTSYGNVVGRITALSAIERWKKYKESVDEDVSGDAYIFSNQYGEVIRDFREGFKAVLEEANVDKDAKGNNLVIYSLRHTYITFRIKYGKVNVHNLAKNCRTSISMIQAYYDDSLTEDFIDELSL